MGGIADRLKRAARRLVVVDVPDAGGSVVYQIRRATAADLAAAGFAELPPASALASAMAEISTQADLDSRLLDSRSPEDREAARAAWLAQRELEGRQVLEKLRTDPAAALELLSRCDAYLVASVEAAGMALPETEPGLVDEHRNPSDVCVELAPGRYLEPLRLVRGSAAADEVSLSDMSEPERVHLGILVMSAFNKEVRAMARTFRERDRVARADGRVGEAVRAAPARPVGDPGAGGGGVRPARARRGQASGGGAKG